MNSIKVNEQKCGLVRDREIFNYMHALNTNGTLEYTILNRSSQKFRAMRSSVSFLNCSILPDIVIVSKIYVSVKVNLATAGHVNNTTKLFFYIKVQFD